MRYFKVQWTDAAGAVHLSDPLTTWTDAALYRAELLTSGALNVNILRF